MIEIRKRQNNSGILECEKKLKTDKFCHSILGLKVGKSKALANLVMGLASQTTARSVVEVSLSGCYHYQFSSISKVLSGLCVPWARPGCAPKDLGEWRLMLEKNFVDQAGIFCQTL
ncbi:MAG: hypothetical protein AAF587_41320 [Bacteroidota bacterium]